MRKPDKSKLISWQLALHLGASASEITGMRVRFAMAPDGDVGLRVIVGLKGQLSKHQVMDGFWPLKFTYLQKCTVDIGPEAVRIRGKAMPITVDRQLAGVISTLRRGEKSFLSAGDADFMQAQWRKADAMQWYRAARELLIENDIMGGNAISYPQQRTRISARKPPVRLP